MRPPALDGDAVYSSLWDDPNLGELVELYVHEMPEQLQRLVDLCDRSDWEQLARSAHQIRGAAGSYGFHQVTPYAARLEAILKTHQPETAIRQSLQDLLQLCCRIAPGAPHGSVDVDFSPRIRSAEANATDFGG